MLTCNIVSDLICLRALWCIALARSTYRITPDERHKLMAGTVSGSNSYVDLVFTNEGNSWPSTVIRSYATFLTHADEE